MILLTFKEPGSSNRLLGIKTEHGVMDVVNALGELSPGDTITPTTVEAVIQNGSRGMQMLAEFIADVRQHPNAGTWFLDEATLDFGPCLPNPGKIFCIGLNYRKHAAETKADVPESPVVFSKFNNSVAGDGDVIPLPANAERYDYEVELGVVIGKHARHVSEADALDYVFGYCTANDLSARDLQKRTSQWLLGKTLNKFFPIGPYLVTTDEIPNPQALTMHTWLNGELRQDSNTGDMIFSVAKLISYISQYIPLEPGDIIATGTPEGVILGMEHDKRVWIKPGDEVVVEVEPLGRLTNTFAAEQG